MFYLIFFCISHSLKVRVVLNETAVKIRLQYLYFRNLLGYFIIHQLPILMLFCGNNIKKHFVIYIFESFQIHQIVIYTRDSFKCAVRFIKENKKPNDSSICF